MWSPAIQDLWIDPTHENACRIREALIRFGGWGDGMTLEHFSTQRTMFQIGLPPSRVDFLTTVPGLTFQEAYQNRKLVPIGELEAPFLSLGDLITAKQTAGRPEDLRDLAGLKEVAGDTDQVR